MKKLGMASIVSTLFLVGCATTNPTDPAEEAAVMSTALGTPTNVTCKDWDQVQTDSGFLINNNTWNAQEAKSKPYTQCIQQRGEGASKQYGWNWNWPVNSNSKMSGMPYAFPEVVYGKKSADPQPNSKAINNVKNLPIQIDSINKFVFSYDVLIKANGTYDLAPELWITDGRSTTAELMIWTDHQGSIGAGKVQAKTEIDGITYEIYFNPIWDDKSGANKTMKWKNIVYIATTTHHKITLDIKKFLGDSVKRGFIPSTDYVRSLEFGTELAQGSGSLWIKSISLDVQ